MMWEKQPGSCRNQDISTRELINESRAKLFKWTSKSLIIYRFSYQCTKYRECAQIMFNSKKRKMIGTMQTIPCSSYLLTMAAAVWTSCPVVAWFPAYVCRWWQNASKEQERAELARTKQLTMVNLPPLCAEGKHFCTSLQCQCLLPSQLILSSFPCCFWSSCFPKSGCISKTSFPFQNSLCYPLTIYSLFCF